MNFPLEIENIIQERSKWIHKKGFSKFKKILDEIPEISAECLKIDGKFIEISSKNPIKEDDFQKIKVICEKLIPWKKGPFKLFGLEVDAEWRSDMKWDRIKGHLPELKGKDILDIGANNGYYMFKMAAQNPNLILGIDPIMNSYTQFHFIQKLAKVPSLKFELLGIEHLKFFKECFDVIFSMGIIYHHKNPMEQLQDIRNALKPSGTVILESIGIPGETSSALFPESTYAKMKNIWFIPTLSCMINWARKANFKNIEVVYSTKMSPEEQRNTYWYPKPLKSLEDFLDKNDKDKTIEGLPAPMRFCLKLEKKD